ncbi:MAG: uracil-DNA glycosylase [Candidatus Micrarchaeia archaeon]
MNDKKIEELARQIKSCKKCRLWKTRKNAVPGEGPSHARLFFVGEAPGKNEDETGRPFVGQSGKLLSKFLRDAGIDRHAVFITSILKCRPPGNRKPKRDEVRECKPYLLQQIKAVRPELIILLGSVAIESMLGNHERLNKMHGQTFRIGDYNYFITYHPAAARRFPKTMEKMKQDFAKLKGLIR